MPKEHLFAAVLVLVALVLVTLLLFTRRRLASLLGVIASLVGGGATAHADKPKPPKPDQRRQKVDAKLAPILKTAEWRRLAEVWARLNKVESRVKKTDGWKARRSALKEAADRIKTAAAELERLRDRGLLTKEEARSLTALFTDRFSHLRRSYSGRSCYRMTREGSRRASTRSELEAQLALLDNFHRKGTLSKSTVDKVKAKIERNLARHKIRSKSRAMALVFELSQAAATR
jgi:hypothetical protein